MTDEMTSSSWISSSLPLSTSPESLAVKHLLDATTYHPQMTQMTQMTQINTDITAYIRL